MTVKSPAVVDRRSGLSCWGRRQARTSHPAASPIVSRPRLLLIDCDASPVLVQSVPTTLSRSAVANRPAIIQPSFDPALRPHSPVCSSVAIGATD